jgi:hypothetical protein
LNHSLKRGKFGIVDRDWVFADSYHLDHARRHKNGKAIQEVELAEYVARKQGQFNLFDPIRPTAPASVNRQKEFEPLAAQMRGSEMFISGSCLQRKP